MRSNFHSNQLMQVKYFSLLGRGVVVVVMVVLVVVVDLTVVFGPYKTN